MDSIAKKIAKRIKAKQRGWVFSSVDFQDLGSRKTVDQTLLRLKKEGRIRQLTRGIYDNPRKSRFGLMPPRLDDVAEAIVRSTGDKIQVSETSAANMLGLTTQVPAKSIYYTNGTPRERKVGNQTIIFKRAPKRLAGAGKITGLVIQSLRYFGKERIDQSIIKQIRQVLNQRDMMNLEKERARVPVWIQDAINQIIAQTGS